MVNFTALGLNEKPEQLKAALVLKMKI